MGGTGWTLLLKSTLLRFPGLLSFTATQGTPPGEGLIFFPLPRFPPQDLRDRGVADRRSGLGQECGNLPDALALRMRLTGVGDGVLLLRVDLAPGLLAAAHDPIAEGSLAAGMAA